MSEEPLDAAAANHKKRRAISVLPQEVVDQIAAGEVVQRPASVVKELLENCLDAGSTQINIKVEKGGLAKLTIQDNGCGIPKEDLALAATRHATSKLRSVQDFHSLSTYGFRGEALASISMVSLLTITSRTEKSPVGFTQTYRNGTPTSPQPRPGARKPGTTLIVQDLFHNVPHRLRTYEKRESEEYNKILQVVQYYAIRYPHCGFCLEKKHHQQGNLVDVNTGQLSQVQGLAEKKNKGLEASKQEVIEATKSIMAHVLGPNFEQNVTFLEASMPANGDAFTYSAQVYCSLPTYNAKKAHFILFLNNRLVDLPALKRSLEDVYSGFNKQQKSMLVVNVTVPGSQVDVNVHPSKRQVALMYQEELCNALATALKTALHESGQSFANQSVALAINNPYKKKRKVIDATPDDEDEDEEPKQSTETIVARPPAKKTRASQLIRTNKASQAGAIEPFLFATPSKSPSQGENEDSASSVGDGSIRNAHKSGCPMNSADLSQPGAFALQCICSPSTLSSPAAAVIVKRPVVRPKRVIPTPCTYSSIGSLRRRVNKHLDNELAKDLREAYFVGMVSPFRSLVQCNERLVMIHHLELAKELFYQLALARFGGATMAQLGNGGVDTIDVESIIAHSLQLEDDLMILSSDEAPEKLKELEVRRDLLEVNSTNKQMAQQATSCLEDHANMLEEYFSIRIEKEQDRTLLTGLPVLLEGHSPEPHGLAIFLLRLATRVDWAEERTCFHGICTELGNYYALLPTKKTDLEMHVKHTLFPAISYLLLPPCRFQNDDVFTTMTKLSTLYKVFERC